MLKVLQYSEYILTTQLVVLASWEYHKKISADRRLNFNYVKYTDIFFVLLKNIDGVLDEKLIYLTQDS